MTSISLKTGFGTEISITDDFTDIADLMESVTTLLVAAGNSIPTIRDGYEAELQRVKEYIQCEIKEEQKATENNE